MPIECNEFKMIPLKERKRKRKRKREKEKERKRETEPTCSEVIAYIHMQTYRERQNNKQQQNSRHRYGYGYIYVAGYACTYIHQRHAHRRTHKKKERKKQKHYLRPSTFYNMQRKVATRWNFCRYTGWQRGRRWRGGGRGRGRRWRCRWSQEALYNKTYINFIWMNKKARCLWRCRRCRIKRRRRR